MWITYERDKNKKKKKTNKNITSEKKQYYSKMVNCSKSSLNKINTLPVLINDEV